MVTLLSVVLVKGRNNVKIQAKIEMRQNNENHILLIGRVFESYSVCDVIPLFGHEKHNLNTSFDSFWIVTGFFRYRATSLSS